MIHLLETLLALGLIAQALVGLAFFISCCWEGERRAALWAGVQAAAMVAATVLFLYLWHRGFFSSGRGVYLMNTIMDSVEFKDGGTVVELEKTNARSRNGATNDGS